MLKPWYHASIFAPQRCEASVARLRLGLGGRGHRGWGWVRGDGGGWDRPRSLSHELPGPKISVFKKKTYGFCQFVSMLKIHADPLECMGGGAAGVAKNP